MKRSNLNFTVDLLTLLLMLAMAVTGLIIRYVLPPGSGGHDGGPGRALLGLSRHGWGAVHFWLAVALIAVLAVHVALHWTWVCTVAGRWIPGGSARRGRQLQRSQTAYGIGLAVALIAVVGGLVWLANTLVVEKPGRQHRGRRVEASTEPYELAGDRGRLTQKEVGLAGNGGARSGGRGARAASR